MNGVSIVIAVWNQLGYTRLTVESILRNTRGIPFELIIVDNGPGASGGIDRRGRARDIKGFAINSLKREATIANFRPLPMSIPS